MTMNRHARRVFAKQRAAMPEQLVVVPRDEWPAELPGERRRRVLVSRRFLVQEFEETDGVIRLSVLRAELAANGVWKDGITWDDLQRIKDEIGYADRDVIEVYPPAADLVNVSNIRHLWVLPYRLPFVWRAPA